MRNMSFLLTLQQLAAGTKDVTRRLGWARLQPDTLVQAVEKSQGLGKGGVINRLCVLRVTAVRRERLDRLVTEPSYGEVEVVREGFRGLSPAQFVAMFCGHMRCQPDVEVTRIEFVKDARPQQRAFVLPPLPPTTRPTPP